MNRGAVIHLYFVSSDVLQPCFSCVVFEQSVERDNIFEDNSSK